MVYHARGYGVKFISITCIAEKEKTLTVEGDLKDDETEHTELSKDECKEAFVPTPSTVIRKVKKKKQTKQYVPDDELFSPELLHPVANRKV